jgi:prepilin-type N-terminal cleavage/methylation domain-containing protein
MYNIYSMKNTKGLPENSFSRKSMTGFTLIELLVVIAIIGILSSVVLSSLNTARAKGADATIKQDLANMRAQAGIFYDNNSQTFGADATACDVVGSVFLDPNIVSALAGASLASGGTAICNADDGIELAENTASSWSMSVPLKTDPLSSWCVDSAGTSAVGTSTKVDFVAVCQQ